MQSSLRNIQNSVLEYANTIANVIGVDVEIVDNQLNTIAGTGPYREKYCKRRIHLYGCYQNRTTSCN